LHKKTEWDCSGQAESNLEGGVTRSCNESPLTELGRSHAKKLAARLQNEKFDLVYSSDLSRAYDTCLAITGDPEVIVKDQLLRERDLGRFEGQPTSVLRNAVDSVKEDGMPWLEAFCKISDDTMETEEDMEKRLKTVLANVIDKVLDGERDEVNVLISAHGFVVRAFALYFAQNFKNNMLPVSEFQYQHIPNTGVTKLDLVVDKSSGEIKEVIQKILFCGQHLQEDYK